MKNLFVLTLLSIMTSSAWADHVRNFSITGISYNKATSNIEIGVEYTGCGAIAKFDYWMSECLKSAPPQIFIGIKEIIAIQPQCHSNKKTKGVIQLSKAALGCAPTIVHVMRDFDSRMQTHKDYVYSTSVN